MCDDDSSGFQFTSTTRPLPNSALIKEARTRPLTKAPHALHLHVTHPSSKMFLQASFHLPLCPTPYHPSSSESTPFPPRASSIIFSASSSLHVHPSLPNFPFRVTGSNGHYSSFWIRSLIKRFEDHKSVRAAIEILKADQSDLGGRLADVQQGLEVTTDQARNSRKDHHRLPRGVDGGAWRRAPRCPSCDDTARGGAASSDTTLTDQVRFDLLGIRTATQALLQQIGSATATALSPPPPSTSPAADPLLRQDPWAATAVPPSGLAGGAGVSPSALTWLRQVRDELLRFEVNMKMREGPGHDRKLFKKTKDASSYAS